MDDSEMLIQCPFCGSYDVHLRIGQGRHKNQNMVECHRCGATVSYEDKPGKDDVIKAWNRRF